MRDNECTFRILGNFFSFTFFFTHFVVRPFLFFLCLSVRGYFAHIVSATENYWIAFAVVHGIHTHKPHSDGRRRARASEWEGETRDRVQRVSTVHCCRLLNGSEYALIWMRQYVFIWNYAAVCTHTHTHPALIMDVSMCVRVRRLKWCAYAARYRHSRCCRRCRALHVRCCCCCA